MRITPRLQITLRHWSGLKVPGHSVSPFTLLASSKQSQADVEYQSPAPLLQGRTISDVHSCVLSSHGHRLSVGFLKSHPYLASSHFLSFIPRPFLISPGSPKSPRLIHPDPWLRACFCRMPWSLFFECWTLHQLVYSPHSFSSRGSLVPLCFLP